MISINVEEVLRELESIQEDDTNPEGNIFGYVYSLGKDFDRLHSEVYKRYLHSTGLDIKAFPSASYLEKSVIGLMLDLVHAPNNSQGTFTSGGTESIILALKSIRDKNNNNGRILIPETAHPSFIKGCKLLGLQYQVIAVDSQYQIVLSSVIEELEKGDVIGLVGSSPCYGIGVLDNIEALSELAVKYKCDLIVDGALGGMILPFLDLDYEWDFKLPGVSIITIDLHKYGYCPKGSGVVLYRDGNMINHQTFTLSSWYGYSIVNSTLMNTKTVTSLASSYVTLKAMGYSKYRQVASACVDAANKIREFIMTSDCGIEVLGNPTLNIFSLVPSSRDNAINIYRYAEEMNKKGWYIQAQLGYKEVHSSVHISVGYQNLHKVNKFLRDTLDVCHQLRLHDKNSTSECKINNLDIQSRDVALRSTYLHNLDCSLVRRQNKNSLSRQFYMKE